MIVHPECWMDIGRSTIQVLVLEICETLQIMWEAKNFWRAIAITGGQETANTIDIFQDVDEF